MTALLTLAERCFFRLAEMSGGAVACLFLSMLACLGLYYIRCSKRVSYLILLLVLVRLLLPVELSTPLSVFNTDFGRALRAHYTLPADSPVGAYEVAVERTDALDRALAAGIPAQRYNGDGFAYANYTVSSSGTLEPAKTFREAYGRLCGAVWLIGFTVFALYGIIGTMLLRRRVSQAVRIVPGVYESDRIASPFILGLLRPRIYLPTGLSPRERELILCHERAHIRWGDVWIKALFYLAICLHWFNPLLWCWYFRLLPEVMEEACDQSVLRIMGEDCRADYSQALLRFGPRHPRRYAMTVAFGESSLKDRIRLILKGKRPLRWLTLCGTLVLIVCMLTLGTDAHSQPSTTVHAESRADSTLFTLSFGDSVGSASLELEAWRGAKQISSQHLLSWNDTALPALEESGLTVSWSQLKSSLTCRAAQGASAEASASLEIPDGASAQFDSAHGFPSAFGAVRGAQTSLVLACRVWGSDQLPLASPDGDPVLAEGQSCVLLRLRLSPSVLSRAALSSGEFWPFSADFSGNALLSAKNTEKTLPLSQLSELCAALRALPCTGRTLLGSTAGLASEGLPEITLTPADDPAHPIRFVLQDSAVLTLDSRSGELTRFSVEPLALADVRAQVLDLLGISYDPTAIYGLSRQIGVEKEGLTLLAALPEHALWLYADTFGQARLLLEGHLTAVLSYFDRESFSSMSFAAEAGMQSVLLLFSPNDAEPWALFYTLGSGAESVFMSDTLAWLLPVEAVEQIPGDAAVPYTVSLWLDGKSYDFPLDPAELEADFGEFSLLSLAPGTGGLDFTAVYSLRRRTDSGVERIPCLRVTGTVKADAADGVALTALQAEPLSQR